MRPPAVLLGLPLLALLLFFVSSLCSIRAAVPLPLAAGGRGAGSSVLCVLGTDAVGTLAAVAAAAASAAASTAVTLAVTAHAAAGAVAPGRRLRLSLAFLSS